MKDRYSDRRLYFEELAQTSKEYISRYISTYKDIKSCHYVLYDSGAHIGRYDLVILHNVIEHIEPEDKDEFMSRAKALLRSSGVIMSAFPAWKMPFGGHQQICRNRLCRLPFIHLLPERWYEGYLKICKEKDVKVNELISIRRSGMSIEDFESLCNRTGLKIKDRTLWLINPHYKAKFGLRPVKLHKYLTCGNWIRNHMSTSCFYILSVT